MRAVLRRRAQNLTVADIKWCDIASSGLLRFDGLDTQAFLQGQLTSNVQLLSQARSQYSGYCTAKGRLLACLLLWQREGAVHMMLPRELCEPVRKRLSMYILRAKVKTVDVSAEHVFFGISGDGAAAIITSLHSALPATVHDVAHGDGFSIVKLPVHRYLIAASPSAAVAIAAALTKITAASPASLWAQLDIEAGIPSVVGATQEQFVPQTVNFDFIGAVSFDKGCYPGQEIVARMHYLGKLKQRMVRAYVVSSDAPAAGDKLYSDAFGDQASGMIVNAVSRDASHHDVLAVIQTGSIEKSDVHFQSPDGPPLQIAALPYLVK